MIANNLPTALANDNSIVFLEIIGVSQNDFTIPANVKVIYSNPTKSFALSTYFFTGNAIFLNYGLGYLPKISSNVTFAGISFKIMVAHNVTLRM